MIEQLLYQGWRYGEPEYTAANAATQQAGTALLRGIQPDLNQ